MVSATSSSGGGAPVVATAEAQNFVPQLHRQRHTLRAAPTKAFDAAAVAEATLVDRCLWVRVCVWLRVWECLPVEHDSPKMCQPVAHAQHDRDHAPKRPRPHKVVLARPRLARPPQQVSNAAAASASTIVVAIAKRSGGVVGGRGGAGCVALRWHLPVYERPSTTARVATTTTTITTITTAGGGGGVRRRDVRVPLWVARQVQQAAHVAESVSVAVMVIAGDEDVTVVEHTVLRWPARPP